VNNTDHNGELHGANCTCDSESTWVVTEVTCGYYDDGSGSGDGSTNSPWIPNTGNEPGGGYGDPNNPNNNGSGPTEIFAAPTPIQTQAELLATYLDLNPQQEIWANKSQNENQVRAINNYLFANCGADTNSSGCQEAQAFAATALVAEMEDGEVDFENEIIKHPSIVGTRAECVVDELISEGNNLFKTVSEAFTNNDSEFRIVFMVADSPSNSPAHTPMPEDTGLIYIKIDPDYVNGNAIDLASIIMHETIHAELHRIFIAGKQGPNPMPQNLFNWYLKLWNFYNNGNQNDTATAAEHNYMAAHYIDNIAQGIREFDQNAQSIEHYKGFSWEGLSSYGVEAGYISNQEFGEFLVLSSIVYSDNHINSCGE
ncbi:hypothetical protein, partial [Bizionia sp.]|uniref:hypothetical protein n=1 Tax=Bizionia sp. TaxID=1954480 RepID=UPI003A8E652A